MALDSTARIVGFTALVELATGIALLLNPALVVFLLLRTPTDATAQVVARGLGIALLALAAALRPLHGATAVAAPVVQAALIYNALMALFLASVSIVLHMGGLLVWAAVALHAILAVLRVTTWQRQYQKKTAQ
jgi:hypothetical protein